METLSAQLQAYRGVTPEAAAALQADNAALAAARQAAEQLAAEQQRRQQEAARRVAEGIATWERLQGELQGENTRLAAALARVQGQAADLLQDKEVLRARVAMLEARGPTGTPASLLALQPGGGAAQQEQQEQQQYAAASAATSAAAAADAAAARQEAADLRQQLVAALEKLEARQASAGRYKKAVRALKRRVADLEQELVGQRAAADAAVQQAHGTAVAEEARGAAAAAALRQCEQQLAEARGQCEEYSRRLAAAEGQLKQAEFARAQWEWRAQDAEQRSQAAGEAAEASTAAAARLAGRRHAQAADVHAQAKAACLRALVSGALQACMLCGATAVRVSGVHTCPAAALPCPSLLHAPLPQQLEKQLTAARQEADALREQLAPPQADAASARELQALRAQLVAAQQRHAATEQQLRGKSVALAASEKRLRQFEAAMRRLAGKAGGSSAGSEDWVIGTRACD